MTTSDALAYYAAHSSITDPGKYAALYEQLPQDIESLAAVINGLLLHTWRTMKYRDQLPMERRREIEIHHAARMIDRIFKLDEQPLTVARPAEKKLIIDCRHFATLLCSILRTRGIPARVRVGFATYLEETHAQDHYVCEYWKADEERWVMEDVDLDKHDVSPHEFIVAGRAWQRVRAGDAPADRFGYAPDFRGLFTIVEDLIRDVATLNKVEILSADSWGSWFEKGKTNMSGDDLAFLDGLAKLTTGGNEAFSDLRTLYENDADVRVPRIITSYNYITDMSHQVSLGA
jgi:hypothetical protein